MRTNRLAVVLASSAVLALTLTACGGGEGDAKSESVGSAPTKSTDTTATPAASASISASAIATKGVGSQGSGKGGVTGAGAAKNSAVGTGSGSAKPVECSSGVLKYAVKKVRSPINHVLVAATNTGSKACNVYSYPILRFSDDQQALTAKIGESKPQAVVTLDRGATAYAGVITATADRNSEFKVTASSIVVGLLDRNEQPIESDPGADVPVPGGSLYVEVDNAQVTYWQDNASDALAW